MNYGRTQNLNKTLGQAIFLIFMFVLALTMMVPFFWMISSSLKYDAEVFTVPMRWIPSVIRWENYTEVWNSINFGRYYINSLAVAVAGTSFQLFISCTAAYAFARIPFRGRGLVFTIYMATMMVPWHSIMIPQFMVMRFFNLFDSLSALILLQGFSAFGIFLLRQFFMGIPVELSEAAKIDGCGEFRIFWKIILPQAGPGVATLVVFTFTHIFNDYLAPLIYISSRSNYTVQLALRLFETQFTMQYALIMAGTVSALAPVFLVFLVCEKYITQGIVFSGLKG